MAAPVVPTELVGNIRIAHIIGKKELPPSPAISDEQTAALIGLAQLGDIDARDTIILANLRFCAKQVRRICPSVSPDQVPEMLVAATYGHPPGENGLIRAITKYNPAHSKFRTYAAHWVRAALQSVVRSHAPQTGSPWRVAKARRVRARLEAQYGPQSDAQVAKAAGLSASMVAVSAMQHVAVEHIPPIEPDQHETYENKRARQEMLAAVRDVSPIAARVIELRYFDDLDPTDVAGRLRMSVAQVGKLEALGHDAIRAYLEEDEQ